MHSQSQNQSIRFFLGSLLAHVLPESEFSASQEGVEDSHLQAPAEAPQAPQAKARLQIA